MAHRYRSRSRGRHQRRSVDDYYLNALDSPHYHQDELAIEQDRLYAERLSHTFYQDDNQFEQDRQLALQLARQRSASPAREVTQQRDESPLYRAANEDTESEFGDENEEPAGALDDIATQDCVVCAGDTTATTSVLTDCEHRMCRTCLRRLFRSCMTDETLFPPRCCRANEIPIPAARAILGDAFPANFEEKAVEFRTVDRTYCHVPTCSTFVPPEYVTNDAAICPTCNEWTCTLCKQAGHRRGECPQDPALRELEAMAAENGWRRCGGCGGMVELNYGCNHMTCRCGHQFCYRCGVQWRHCDCNDFDPQRLLLRAADIATRPRNRPLNALASPLAQPPPPRQRDPAAINQANHLLNNLQNTAAANQRARQRAATARAARPVDPNANINDIAAHLRENHQCDHQAGGRWRRFHQGVNRCEICSRVKANPAVGECPVCWLQACYYCRRHRMRMGE